MGGILIRYGENETFMLTVNLRRGFYYLIFVWYLMEPISVYFTFLKHLVGTNSLVYIIVSILSRTIRSSGKKLDNKEPINIKQHRFIQHKYLHVILIIFNNDRVMVFVFISLYIHKIRHIRYYYSVINTRSMRIASTTFTQSWSSICIDFFFVILVRYATFLPNVKNAVSPFTYTYTWICLYI